MYDAKEVLCFHETYLRMDDYMFVHFIILNNFIINNKQYLLLIIANLKR